jgi:putative ABC transport system permease protein
MSLLSLLRSFGRHIVYRNEADNQLDDEIRSQLELMTDQKMKEGMSAEKARRAAVIELGGVEQVKEEVRAARTGAWLDPLLQDGRFALRMLRKNPGFTAAAVLTLALGIGANTAIFSLVNAVLLRPLPFRDPAGLVGLQNGSYPKGAFAAMRERVHALDVAAYSDGHQFNLTGQGDPVRLSGTLVSAELFSILGVQPQLGRLFLPGQDHAGQDSFVILSDRLWRSRFASDPSVIGHVIDLDGVSREIVGVMPPSFRFPSSLTDVWIPLDIDPRNASTYWAGDFMPVIGHLRPGATIAEADAELAQFNSDVRRKFPWPMPNDWNVGVAAVPLQRMLVGDLRQLLLILLGAVAVVLLIACANVANLALARGSTRAKEMAVRASLGASRIRIMRQLITESVVTALAGCVLGICLAASCLSLPKASFPSDTPGLATALIDWRVFLFAIALALIAGLVSGLAPSIECSRTQLSESLKSAGRGVAASSSRSARRALVTGEVALAILLVSAAGLLIRSLWLLAHVNPGFGSEHLLTMRIAPNESFCDNADRCVGFYRQVIEGVRALPGVAVAAVVNTLPLDGEVNKRSIELEGKPTNQDLPLVWQNIVSPGYFGLMKIPLLRGRALTGQDSTGNPPVVILSASTAKRLWPGEDALGKHIRLSETQEWCTVVGIVGDVRAFSLRQSIPDWMQGTIYLPYSPKSTLENKRIPAEMTLAIRTTNDDSGTIRSVRDVVSGLDADATVSQIQAMSTVVSEAALSSRSVTTLFASFAAIAFLLGAIGIYGVISFFVSQRTREIGIRMALGAQPRHVLRMIIREGLSMIVAGIAIGLIAALALTHFLSSLLYGVSPTDPVALCAVAALFTAVALLACYAPARRAMRINPVTAMRSE